MKRFILGIFIGILLMGGYIYFLISNELKKMPETISYTRVLNIHGKAPKVTGKIIYEGDSRYINLQYETLHNFNDILRVIIFDKNKNIIYCRKFKSKNIEIQYY